MITSSEDDNKLDTCCAIKTWLIPTLKLFINDAFAFAILQWTNMAADDNYADYDSN